MIIISYLYDLLESMGSTALAHNC